SRFMAAGPLASWWMGSSCSVCCRLGPLSVLQSPFEILGASEPDLHCPGNRLFLGDVVVQHEVRDHGAADAIAAATVEEDGAVMVFPQNREDLLQLGVAGGAGGDGNVDVGHAQLLDGGLLVEGAGLHGVADIKHDAAAGLPQRLDLLRGGLPAGDDVRQGLAGIDDAGNGFDWSWHLLALTGKGKWPQ